MSCEAFAILTIWCLTDLYPLSSQSSNLFRSKWLRANERFS